MNRESEIFAAALELAPHEQASFVAVECAGDPELQARVMELLQAYAQAGEFLEESPVVHPPAPTEQAPGDVIGPYTLVRKLGEGGCGVVYLASQTTPVRRDVALKVIKVGMDTEAVIARFEAERQALAMMEHTHIARVFDAGSTSRGRPYFVMEYIAGVPITQFCDRESLGLEDRLNLFAHVCQAMQHAHQKGIIHRDVKPSNILVAYQDGVPTPKIIDFGIAKATQGKLTEHTLITSLDQFIGTPAYMSPEQIERRDLDIDTRSDIYALGVLLYELLTGRPPYDPQSLLRAGVDEIRRIIREVDPPRPSTAVSTLTNADRTTIARLRQSGPNQLTSVLRGDLDWVVMRCLEKDRDRRYPSAEELAADIRRHLASEPVVARPPSPVYRTRKFIRRNRFACASVVLIATSLIIGTVVSVQQAIRAIQAERAAMRRQEDAETLLTFMLGDFRSELKKTGKLDLLESVGAKAMSYFDALDPRDLSDAALTRQAQAITQIGETRIDQARYPEAAQAFATAYARAAALASRHPQNTDMLFERAQAEYYRGFIARQRGDFAEAEQWYTAYRESALMLFRLEGSTLRAENELIYGHHNLAALALDQGRLEQARTGLLAEREAVHRLLSTYPDDLDILFGAADVESWLGSVAEESGNLVEARERFSAMASYMTTLRARDPDTAQWRFLFAESQTFIGQLDLLSGKLAAAEEHFAIAHQEIDALRAIEPNNQRWRFSSLTLDLQRAEIASARGQYADARDILKTTTGGLASLVAAEPTSRNFSRYLGAARRLAAELALLPGSDSTDALIASDAAVAIGDPLMKTGRADAGMRGEFARMLITRARVNRTHAEANAAEADLARAEAELAPELSTTADWRLLDPAWQIAALQGRSATAREILARLRTIGFTPIDPLALALATEVESTTATLP